MTLKPQNNYQKVLGVSFLILVFATIVSLVYLWQAKSNSFFRPHYKIESQKVTYHNTQYNFDVPYFKSYNLDTSGRQPNYFKSGGTTLTSISIPKETFPDTNYNSGQITYAVKEKTTLADCQTYITGADTSKKMSQTVTLGDQKYYVGSFTGAAAGTNHHSMIYRLLKDGNCYEANITVGISSIENYEPGAVTAVVVADIWNDLSTMLVNTKFNATTTQN